MLTEDGKHLYVSYDEYHNLIEKLALKVYQSGWEFDTILCLARGGMRPGDILGRIFNKPLAIMEPSTLPNNRIQRDTGRMKISRMLIGNTTGVGSAKLFSHFFPPFAWIPANSINTMLMIARAAVTFMSFSWWFKSQNTNQIGYANINGHRHQIRNIHFSFFSKNIFEEIRC